MLTVWYFLFFIFFRVIFTG